MQAFIGNIEPHSSGVWKGKDCFVIYFAGCNFNCPFCNSSNIKSSKEEFLVDLKDIKKQIKENLHSVDTVFFGGGEPCLQRPAILDLAGFAKGLNLKVGILTNGSKPETIKSMIDNNALDYVAMDLKAPLENDIFQKVTKSSTFFINNEEITNDIKATVALLRKHDKKLQIEFRTTIVPGLMFKKEDLIVIGSIIEGIDSRWVLQRFLPDNVKNRAFSQIDSPSELFLNNMKEALQKIYPNMRIEVA